MSLHHVSTMMTAPFFRDVTEKLAELESAAAAMADAIADYEAAADAPRSEQADMREDARDALYESLGEWCVTAKEVLALREKLEAAVDG